MGQAMAGLDVETFLAYRTYASSPNRRAPEAPPSVTLDADYATGNSFIYIIAGWATPTPKPNWGSSPSASGPHRGNLNQRECGRHAKSPGSARCSLTSPPAPGR